MTMCVGLEPTRLMQCLESGRSISIGSRKVAMVIRGIVFVAFSAYSTLSSQEQQVESKMIPRGTVNGTIGHV